MPENLFYNTNAAGVIVVLNKRKPAARKGKIVLLNASKHVKKGKPKNYIPDEDIRPLAALYLKGEAVESTMAVVTKEQLEESDYVLSPSRWVGQTSDVAGSSLATLLKQIDEIMLEDAGLTRKLLSSLAPLKALAQEQSQ